MRIRVYVCARARHCPTCTSACLRVLVSFLPVCLYTRTCASMRVRVCVCILRAPAHVHEKRRKEEGEKKTIFISNEDEERKKEKRKKNNNNKEKEKKKEEKKNGSLPETGAT